MLGQSLVGTGNLLTTVMSCYSVDVIPKCDRHMRSARSCCSAMSSMQLLPISLCGSSRTSWTSVTVFIGISLSRRSTFSCPDTTHQATHHQNRQYQNSGGHPFPHPIPHLKPRTPFSSDTV